METAGRRVPRRFFVLGVLWMVRIQAHLMSIRVSAQSFRIATCRSLRVGFVATGWPETVSIGMSEVLSEKEHDSPRLIPSRAGILSNDLGLFLFGD